MNGIASSNERTKSVVKVGGPSADDHPGWSTGWIRRPARELGPRLPGRPPLPPPLGNGNVADNPDLAGNAFHSQARPGVLPPHRGGAAVELEQSERAGRAAAARSWRVHRTAALPSGGSATTSRALTRRRAVPFGVLPHLVGGVLAAAHVGVDLDRRPFRRPNPSMNAYVSGRPPPSAHHGVHRYREASSPDSDPAPEEGAVSWDRPDRRTGGTHPARICSTTGRPGDIPGSLSCRLPSWMPSSSIAR